MGLHWITCRLTDQIYGQARKLCTVHMNCYQPSPVELRQVGQDVVSAGHFRQERRPPAPYHDYCPTYGPRSTTQIDTRGASQKGGNGHRHPLGRAKRPDRSDNPG